MSRIIDFWKFVTRAPFGPDIPSFSGRTAITVNWFMPPIGRNSGGHINIFRFLRGLCARGFDCRVVISNDGVATDERLSEDMMLRNINEWYGQFDGRAYYIDDNLPAAEISFATGWQSAYAVKQFRGSPNKCYFVQDFEPYFYPHSSEFIFADDTYKFGFTGFTAGKWLSEKLQSEYRMQCYALGFSYDRELYKPHKRNNPERSHVFCYVRPETVRRGLEISLLALDKLHRLRPEVGIILAGGAVDGSGLSFPALVTGSLNQSELPALYSQCDAALVISLTNLSLLPLELMACGVPIVSNSGSNVEWLLNNQVARLGRPTPDDLARLLVEQIDLPEAARRAWSSRVIEFARRTSWDRHFDRLAGVLSVMAHPTPGAHAIGGGT